jgi:molybdenum cofactor cytidylyltransferase
MRFAVLPAAGKSSRMGRPKLALPLGERTLLEHVIAALRRAEVEHVLVVLGPHLRELAMLAVNAGASVHQLTEETAGMRATVEQGLLWLEQRFSPRPDEAWLLVPADLPALVPEVVAALEEARKSHPNYSLFLPTYRGRRGHPLALAWHHVTGIRAHPAGEGLNGYVRGHDAELLEVPVESEFILRDIDTPSDYERLRQTWPLPI